MRYIVVFMSLVSIMCATSCFRTTYKNPSLTRSGDVHSKKQHFFLFGLAGGRDVDLNATCPAGVAEVRSKFSFVDGLLAVLTLDLYAPRSVEVECGRQTTTAKRDR